MSKLTFFIVLYSVVLIALFGTFCYLMTTVNPAEIKPDTYRARKFGIFQDDFIYPNDRLPPNDNDNIGYGLEKADYDTIEIEPEVVPSATNARPEMPSTVKHSTTKIFPEKDKTNCSRKDFDVMKMITKSMKTPVKGLRRSVNENNISLDNPRSLLLKINDVDGQPQIEIKVLTEKLQKTLRKYRSSGNEKNNLNFMNISDIDYDSINKTVINVNENETLVIKINTDSIEYTKTVESLDESEIRYERDRATSKVVELRNNHGNMNIEATKNNAATKQDGENLSNMTSNVNSIDFKFANLTVFNTTDSDTIINAQVSIKEVIKDIPTVNLIGLLLPEATATLPYNYHFIT